jgi:hypothetical protein
MWMDQRFHSEQAMEHRSRPKFVRDIPRKTYSCIEYVNIAPPIEWNATLGQTQAQEDDNQGNRQPTVKTSGSDIVCN